MSLKTKTLNEIASIIHDNTIYTYLGIWRRRVCVIKDSINNLFNYGHTGFITGFYDYPNEPFFIVRLDGEESERIFLQEDLYFSSDLVDELLEYRIQVA